MAKTDWLLERRDFPAFGRGLSLRQGLAVLGVAAEGHFPAFGRELSLRQNTPGFATKPSTFLRLRVGTFIEARNRNQPYPSSVTYFPVFGRGLSLRQVAAVHWFGTDPRISPSSGRDFH